MDAVILQEMIKDISRLYNLTQIEVKAIILKSIAKVYGGINSAALWKDGLVSVAYIKNSTFKIKNYRISKDKFQEILKEINLNFSSYTLKIDIDSYLQENKNKLFEGRLKSLNNTKDKFQLIPTDTLGFLRDFKFYIKNEKLFKQDIYNYKKKNDTTFIYLINRWNTKRKHIECVRLTKDIASVIFIKHFKILVGLFEKQYEIDYLDIRIDIRTKSISIYVEFSVLPSSYFITLITNKLKKELGNVHLKIKRKNI